MPWWGWIVVGVVLLGAELFAVDAEFYLVFLGIAALVVGAGDLVGLDLPVWLQWLSFAALAVLTMLTVRRHLYEKLRRRPLGHVPGDVGERVAIAEELGPGQSCRAEYRGAHWTALNVGARAIPAGGIALIEAIDGLTLRVSAAASEE
ncbi:MAG TPA: NfeD family protein [Gammaproteobacteria bacterium]|nr:NfeD family protein [Gammaproteobacteria bacterium]